MEIQDSSLPGFYCSRILGLAPYSIKKNSKNRVDEIRRSPWLCLYSICFMTVTGKFGIKKKIIEKEMFSKVNLLCFFKQLV